MLKKIVVGNWKMNGLRGDLDKVSMICELLSDVATDVVICPPALLIQQAATACRGSRIGVGGQDCHSASSGAHTGDISAKMLKDAGASHVILGHSERREGHGEDAAAILAKVNAAQNAGLMPILCIGETHTQKTSSLTRDVLRQQLAASVPHTSTGDTLMIAYEPIWAIGTGNSASRKDVQDLHRFIRDELEALVGRENGSAIRILYGGSVNASNVTDFVGLQAVDGFLVGGASLDVAAFSTIVTSLEIASSEI